MTASMTREHWIAAYVAALCSISNASPTEAEAEAEKLIATIRPAIPDDLNHILELGPPENAALATVDRWNREAAEASGSLFEEEPVDDLDSETAGYDVETDGNVDDPPPEDAAP